MITTLADLEAWLIAQPAAKIMCWDTFEPQHCLTVSFYEAQGHTQVRSEFDRAVKDPRQPGETHKPISPIARYENDLIHFLYALHFTPLRFQPTAGDLLAYLTHGEWRTLSIDELSRQQPYPWTDEQYNTHYDSPDRPPVLAWEHREHLDYQGLSCEVITIVDPPLFPDPQRALSVTIIVTPQAPGRMETLQYSLGPKQHHPYSMHRTA